MGTTKADIIANKPKVPEQKSALELGEQLVAEKRKALDAAIGDENKISQDQLSENKRHFEQERKLREGAPEQKKIEPHPRHEFNKKMVLWSSALAIISIAGSRGQKTGANGAMSALNAALNGVMEGNEMAYKMHMDNYRNHLADMAKAHEKEMEGYQKLRDDETLTAAQKAEQFRILQAAAGRTTAIAKLDWEKTLAAQNKLHERTLHLVKEARPITSAQRDELAYKEAKKNEPTLTREAFDLRHKGKKAGNGGASRTGATKTPAEWVAEVTKEHPDWSAQKRAEEAKKRAGIK